MTGLLYLDAFTASVAPLAVWLIPVPAQQPI